MAQDARRIKWRLKNAARERERNKKWRDSNGDRLKQYYEDNKHSFTNNTLSRRRGLKYPLAIIYRGQTSSVYRKARRITAETGVLHTVDHIWPVKGRLSCGLHVPWNLQILTQQENDAKSNREPGA